MNVKCATTLIALGVLGCAANPKPLIAHGNETRTKIFVQAGEGSFNHQALKLLLGDRFESSDIRFAGTPVDTMAKAVDENGDVFVALANTLVPGNLIQATVDAISTYKIVDVKKRITMKIEQCLLRHKQAVSEKRPLTHIASHPAALMQINHWKTGRSLVEIKEPAGTSKAAEHLSDGDYSLETGVIGPKLLGDVYKNLVAVDCGIQDSDANATTFGLLHIAKREAAVSEMQARQEVAAAVEMNQ